MMTQLNCQCDEKVASDLLVTTAPGKKKPPLKIRQDPKKGFYGEWHIYLQSFKAYLQKFKTLFHFFSGRPERGAGEQL